MEITTPLTSSEILIAGWRSSHALYGSYYHMSDSVKVNAAGVPLILLATAGANGGVDVDYSGVPVTAFDPAEVATIDPAEAQRRMDALVAKYDGVTCTMAEGHGQVEGLNEDQFTMGADWKLVDVLTARGADRVLAHEHLAASKAAAAPTGGTSEQQPAQITQEAEGANSGSGSNGDAPPADAPPALVLTKDQHAQTRSELQKIGDELHLLSDKAKLAFSKLVALLHHI